MQGIGMRYRTHLVEAEPWLDQWGRGKLWVRARKLCENFKCCRRYVFFEARTGFLNIYK
jgi:hypothetical protein